MALTEFEDKIVGSVEKLSESVVSIRSTKVARGFPFGEMPMKGSGSGWIADTSGHIVTNYHVVDGAGELEVTLKDGRTYKGKFIGGDRVTDVAVVKISADNLHPANIGDSEKLRAGQTALAIGNSLDLPGGHTVSMGVISALGRPMPWADYIFEGLIQTDAAINPGNSGGPLADSDGNVIGMNTAIVQFAQGVGFAIPVNTIKWVMEQVALHGRVVRPMIGISAMSLDPVMAKRFNIRSQSGVLVADVAPGSPAHKAGLQPGDIIEMVGDAEVRSMKELLVTLSRLGVRQSVKLRFSRENKRHEITVQLAENRIEN